MGFFKNLFGFSFYLEEGQMILKSHLKYFRKELNMTQKMLADLVGVRRETIIFLEKGIYNPSLKLAYKISIVLGKKIDEIFEYGVKSS